MLEEQYSDFAQWQHHITECHACALRKEGNKGPTTYTGDPKSPLMIVGEGPGGVEDQYGVPLVGPSGQLLDKALWSVGITRDRVYVTNIVKCRPRNNRTPTLQEGKFCADTILTKEIHSIQPKVILALGKVAFQYFYGKEGSIMRNRGTWISWQGIPVMPTFHPAFLLRLHGKEEVEHKWNVYYDLKAAKEKALSYVPDYSFSSGAPVTLLSLYQHKKEERDARSLSF